MILIVLVRLATNDTLDMVLSSGMKVGMPDRRSSWSR
jgi:hypothetical protein